MTIYDIAELAGVSASTVSRVINKKPGIRKETQQKVQKLLDQYQFQLNENARGLSTSVMKLVGILVADIRNAHYTEMAYVIETYLMKHEYCSVIVNAGSEPEGMEYGIQVLNQRKVDGVIIIGSIFQNSCVHDAIARFLPNVPVIFANGYLDLPNVYGILVDEYQGVKDCVKLLYDRGYGHIAFVGRMHTESNRLKAQGYECAVTEHGARPVTIEMTEASLGECGFRPLDELMERCPEADAVIFSNDFLAGEATHYFREKEIPVPEKMGIIGINNNDKFCQITHPRITSLDNKMPTMGKMAAKALLDVLNGEEQVKKVMIFPEIVERDSVRRA